MSSLKKPVAPHDLDAERAVLGALLLDKEAIFRVLDIINPEDFYQPAHGDIFAAAVDLAGKRKPIDLLTLVAELRSRKKLEDAGGEVFLAGLVEATPTAAHAFDYAQIVRQKATLRRLIRAGQAITGLGFEEAEELPVTLEAAEKELFRVSGEFTPGGFVHLKELLTATFEQISELNAADGETRGLPTGWPSLDRLLSGLQEGDLVILAARPSMGKTALALNLALNAAKTGEKNVAFFSMEMAKEQLVTRLFASSLEVDSHALRSGNLSPEDFERMGEVIDGLSRANIFIDDGADCAAVDLRAKARRLQMESGLDLIIIDYLQLIRGGKPENRVQEISEITRSLKALARELRVPIVALSQLSRAVEQRPTRIPQLSDLRESGSIEQDADVVMMLYREEMYDEDSDRKGLADIFVRKHRNGPTGHVELAFNKSKQLFSELERHRQEEGGF